MFFKPTDFDLIFPETRDLVTVSNISIFHTASVQFFTYLIYHSSLLQSCRFPLFTLCIWEFSWACLSIKNNQCSAHKPCIAPQRDWLGTVWVYCWRLNTVMRYCSELGTVSSSRFRCRMNEFFLYSSHKTFIELNTFTLNK